MQWALLLPILGFSLRHLTRCWGNSSQTCGGTGRADPRRGISALGFEEVHGPKNRV